MESTHPQYYLYYNLDTHKFNTFYSKDPRRTPLIYPNTQLFPTLSLYGHRW